MHSYKKSYKNHLILAFLIGLLGGILFVKVWIFAGDTNSNQDNQVAPIRLDDKDDQYKLINPLLFCGVSEGQEFEEFSSLEEKTEALIDKKLANNLADKISVYYRVMDGGKWFGINENAKYSPASLLKVPLMISYLKEAESNPDLLSRQIFYNGSFDFNQFEYFKPKVRIQAGNHYSIDKLLEAMVVYSGNNSEKLLFDKINPKTHIDIFTDLGVPTPEEPTSDFMSAKSYSFFFRVLYNSSYLNRQMSEKALQLLSKAHFDHGIAGGIPDYITIAQKFGERTVVDENNNILWRELHDCGIVYDQNSPYLLCVMTKGSNFENLGKIINEISELIYKNRDE